MNPQIYFCKKIRNIIFDTICYRFHSAFDSQFDGVLFDNQEGAYIKTDARLEEIPGIPEILDAWGVLHRLLQCLAPCHTKVRVHLYVTCVKIIFNFFIIIIIIIIIIMSIPCRLR